MTRISSYTQYQCKLCGQIHVKPEYGSISSYVPVDIVIKPNDLKTCKRCGETQEVQKYAEIGRTSTSVTIDTYPEHPTVWQRVRRRLNGKYCKKELPVTDLYPRI